MKIGEAGISLIKSYETLQLVAYLPTPDDVPTIGYGHTKGVRLGTECTEEQADSWLLEDLADAERCVNRKIQGIVITQNQFDALVSFTFNVGCRAFSDSTLLKRLLDGDDLGCYDQFQKWNKQGNKTLAGLTRRRQEEAALFLT